MEPQVQYAKTNDGVNIAFWTIGEGVPLVVTPGLTFSHIQMDWQQLGHVYELLAERARVIRYARRADGD